MNFLLQYIYRNGRKAHCARSVFCALLAYHFFAGTRGVSIILYALDLLFSSMIIITFSISV